MSYLENELLTREIQKDRLQEAENHRMIKKAQATWKNERCYPTARHSRRLVGKDKAIVCTSAKSIPTACLDTTRL